MAGQAVITINNKQWVVDVASMPAELVSGLSGVPSIPPNTGMLFDLGLDRSSIDINTAEMLFNLDIVFINSVSGVAGCCRDVAPGEVCRFQAYTNPGARYFLEVNAGEAEGIEVGDGVDIQGYSVGGSIQALVWWVLPVLIGTSVATTMVARAMEK